MIKKERAKLSGSPNKKTNNTKQIPQTPRVITKYDFIITVLSGTAGALILTLFFVSYAVAVIFNHAQKTTAETAAYNAGAAFPKVAYLNDKNFYQPNEKIKLNIVNNSNESVYLAPCRYFNNFEKKVLNKWSMISLEDCSDINFSPSLSIEKISKKAEDQLSASQLGEGTWRGISTVYFGCKEARTESCVRSQTIYTEEFTIGSKTFPLSVFSE